MGDVDPRVAAALREQLVTWRRSLDGGARRVGWKIGFNIPEIQAQLGISEPVVGHLTSATALVGPFDGRDVVHLRAEAEIALEVGPTVRYAPAIEIVDIRRDVGGIEAIVAGNIFHRGFQIGEFRDAPPGAGQGGLFVNGEPFEHGPLEVDVDFTIDLVRRHLAAVEEELLDGDVIIAGAVAHTAIARGDRVEADLGDLGRLAVEIV